MNDASVSRVKHRNPLTDYQDQALFFGLFLVGAASIWTMKWLGFDQFVVTAIPVSLMFAYVIVALVTKRYRLREDRVGDNVYYLGFLFTLVSLAYALHVYDPEGDGATAIITNFGIAIFTTIIGLAGRVLFNQMREDPVEYEREARYSLADASRTLRSQLFDIAADLTSFKRAMLQITEEGVTEVANSARSSMTTNVEQFAATAQEVIVNIRGAFETFSDHSARLNDLAGRNVDALQALFSRIENIEASPGLIAEKLEPIIAKFEEVADEAMRRNRNQTNDLKRVREVIDAATQASEVLRTTVSAADAGVRERLGAFAASLEASTKLAGQFTKSISEASQTLSVELKAAAEIASGAAQTMTSQKTSVEGLSGLIEGELNRLQQFQVQMERMAQESSEAVQLVQTSLVSLSKQLVEQLGGEHRPGTH